MTGLPIRPAATLAVLGLALWGAAAGAGEIKVTYDRTVDFTRYETWSWGRGTPAPNPVADRRLREAIEWRLIMHFVRVPSGGDLEVVYHAAAESKVGVEKLEYQQTGFLGEATRIRVLREGALLVDMVDTSRGEVVWRGQAWDTAVPSPAALDRMIDEAIEKLFEHFPPES